MTQGVTLQEKPMIRSALTEVVGSLSAFDKLEHQHIHETTFWIQSGAPIFRVEKPDIPAKHLVTYFVLFDEEARAILLVDHKKAQLWLPPGGHVEKDEHPCDTVMRECFEELGIEAAFWKEDPFFLTSTVTVELTAGHTDVTLWYILKGSQHTAYSFDTEEFSAIKWFHFDEIPYEKSDPHMQRFINKLEGYL